MSGLKKAYLALYNAASMAGWAYVLGLTAQHFQAGGGVDGLYGAIEQPLKIVQTTALLEVVHSAVGLVRAPVPTTFIQGGWFGAPLVRARMAETGCERARPPPTSHGRLPLAPPSPSRARAVASRLVVLWGMVAIAPPSQVHPAFTLMAVSWASVEVPRYGYYLASLFGAAPGWLTWLRYSLFMVLYPSGISGEIGCLWNSLPFIKEHGIGQVDLPNPHNVALSYYSLLWVLLVAVYPPGSYVMFTHMLRQRRKVLASGAAAAVAKSKTA